MKPSTPTVICQPIFIPTRISPVSETDGQIMEYFIRKCDHYNKLSLPPRFHGGGQCSHLVVTFQMSGQGPIILWPGLRVPELPTRKKLPSKVERYVSNVERVSTLLNGWLKAEKIYQTRQLDICATVLVGSFRVYRTPPLPAYGGGPLQRVWWYR